MYIPQSNFSVTLLDSKPIPVVEISFVSWVRKKIKAISASATI